MPVGPASCAPAAGPPSPPVPPPANVEMGGGPKADMGPLPAPSSDTPSSTLPLGSESTTIPWRRPGAVGWNTTSTLHFPAVRVGQVVPAATEVKSRFGAPRVRTETLPRVVLDGTVMVNTCVAPGAAKIAKLGAEVTWADSPGAITRRQAETINKVERRAANAGGTCLQGILLSMWKTPSFWVFGTPQLRLDRRRQHQAESTPLYWD